MLPLPAPQKVKCFRVRFRFQLLSSKCYRFRFHKNLTASTASASSFRFRFHIPGYYSHLPNAIKLFVCTEFAAKKVNSEQQKFVCFGALFLCKFTSSLSAAVLARQCEERFGYIKPTLNSAWAKDTSNVLVSSENFLR